MKRVLLPLFFAIICSQFGFSQSDDCATATMLTYPNVNTLAGTNVGATNGGTDDFDITTSNNDENTVWYQVVVMAGEIGFSLDFVADGGTPFANPITVVVLDDCPANVGAEVMASNGASNEFTLSGTPTQLDYWCMPAPSDMIYFIQVGSAAGDFGGFEITYTANQATFAINANDDCGSSTAISASSGASGNNICAGNEGNAIPCAGGNDTNTLWYHYDVPVGVSSVTFDVTNFSPYYNVDGNQSVFLGAYTDDCSFTTYATGSEGCSLSSDNANLEILCPVAGETIKVMVASDADDAGTFNIAVTEVTGAAATNDDCADANVLSDGNPLTGESNQCATSAVGGTSCDAVAYENSVWYEYTVPTGTGVASVEITVDNWSTTASGGGANEIYIGAFADCPATTFYAAGSEICMGGTTNTLILTCPMPGDVINIMVSSSDADQGTFDITLTETTFTPVTNDMCDMATDMSTNLSLTGESNICTTNDFSPTCTANANPTNSVWYSYTFPVAPNEIKGIELHITNWQFLNSTGSPSSEIYLLALDDCNAGTYFNNDNTLEYCGDPGNGLIEIQCPTPGETVFFMVASQEASQGTFDIEIEEQMFPSTPDCGFNETCALAENLNNIIDETLTCDYQSIAGCNLDACPEPQAEMGGFGCNFELNPTVWHMITIPDATPDITKLDVQVLNANANFTAAFAVLEGPCGGPYTSLTNSAGMSSDCVTNEEITSLPVVEGNTYWIAVTDFGGGIGGNYQLDVSLVAAPINDECIDAIDLNAEGLVFTGTTACADQEYDVLACPDTDDINQIWFTYTAPPNLLYIDLHIANDGGSDLAVDFGQLTNCDPLDFVTSPYILNAPYCIREVDDMHICLEEGEIYHIMVSADPKGGDITIDITETFETDITCGVNDDCDNAIDLTPDVDVVAFSCEFQPFPGCNEDACPDLTMSPVFDGCIGEGNPVVWYTVDAPINAVQMIVQINTGSLTDPVLGVYTGNPGTCGGPYTAAVAGSDCITGNIMPTDPINLPSSATGGDQFLIAVGTEGSMGGDFDLEILFIIPPNNDSPCPGGINDPEDLSGGGSGGGTTCCAIGANDDPALDFANISCGTNLDDDAVWYTYTPAASEQGLIVSVTAGTITGNVAVEAYWGPADGGCTGNLVLADSACGPLDAEMSIPICSDPPETLYIKVAAIEENCGTFNIDVSSDSGCTDFADTCDDTALMPGLILEPVVDGPIICATTCNAFACSENDDCNTTNGNSVWVQVNTDGGTTNLIISVDADFSPIISFFIGTDCTDLAGVPSHPNDCGAEANTAVGVGVNNSYWIKIETEDGTIDEDFEVCVSAVANSFDCYESELETTRPDNPTQPQEGPYCAGETVTFCYEIDFTVNGAAAPDGNNCQWIQGIIPVFGPGWDLVESDVQNQAPGGAFWLGDGNVDYNFDNPQYTVVTRPDGSLALEYQTPAGGVLAGDLLPGGWWFTSNGGGGCANDLSDPDTAWGLPTSCSDVQMINFCIDLIAKELDELDGDCEDPTVSGLGVDLFVFADGETGCWEDLSCALSVPNTFDAFMNCDLPEEVVGNDDIICNNGTTNIELSLELGGGDDIIVTVLPNSNVSGQMDHIFTGGAGTIQDVLVNNSGTDQIVIYEAYSIIPGNPCLGPVTMFEVTVLTEITFVPESFDQCQSTDDFPQGDISIYVTPIGGSGVYDNVVWTPQGSAPSGVTNGLYYDINSTGVQAGTYTYEVDVTDSEGCMGSTTVELTIHPEVLIEYDPLSICEDAIDNPIIVPNIISGLDNFNFIYTTSTNLSGYPSSYDFVIDLAGSAYDGNPSFVDVFVTDNNGCQFTTRIEVNLVPGVEIISQVTDLVCNEEVGTIEVVVNNVGPAIQGIEIRGPQPSNTLLAGAQFPNVYTAAVTQEGTYNIEVTDNTGECISVATVDVSFPTIENPILTGTTSICEGEGPAMISVSNASDYTAFAWNDVNASTTSTINVNPTATKTYTVQVTNDQGCTAIAMWEVVVNPNPVIATGQQVAFCPGETVTISAGGDPAIHTYNWTGPGFVTNATDPTAIDITAVGAYNVTVTNPTTTCTSTTQFTTVSSNVQDVLIQGGNICDNTPVNLTAGNGFDTYLWTFDDGTGVVSAPGVNNMQVYSATMPGTYYVATTGGCPGVGQFVVDQFISPDFDITPTYDICNTNASGASTFIDFNAQVTGTNSGGTWENTDIAPVVLTDLTNVDFTGVPAGSYTFTYESNTATPPCVNSSLTMEVTVTDCSCPDPTTMAPAPLCNNGGVLNLNTLKIPFVTDDGTWAFVSTPTGSTVDITDNIFESSGQPAGDYVLEFTVPVPAGSACVNTSQQTLTVYNQPSAVVQGAAAACNVTSPLGSTTLNFNTFVVGDAGVWTFVNSTTGETVALTDIANVDFTGLMPGDYTFSYMTNIASAPCTDPSYPLVVSVSDCSCPPNVTSAPLSALCNDSGMLDLTSLVEAPTGAGNWSLVNGPGGNTLALSGSTFDATGAVPGDYTVAYTLDPLPAANCLPTEQIVTVIAAPELTVTPNAVVCSDIDGDGPTFLDLTSLITLGDTNGTWTAVSGCTLDFSDPSNVSFIGVPSGTCIVSYTTPDNGICTPVSAMVNISVSDCLCPNVTTNPTAPFCNEGSLAFDLSSLETALTEDGHWAFLSGPQTITINNDFFDPTGLAPGEYVVYFELDTPPTDPNCPDTTQQKLIVLEPMNPGVPDQPVRVCFNETMMINLADLLTGEDAGGMWIETSVDGSTGSAFNAANGTFNTNGQNSGTYTFTYGILDAGPCDDVEATVEVIIESLPIADAGIDQELNCTTNSVNMGGNSSTGNNILYSWTEASGKPVANADQASTTATESGTYTLLVTDNSTGCTATDVMVVSLSDDQPQFSVVVEDPLCFGVNDGTITITPLSGGSGNNEYSIDNGVTWQTGLLFSGLAGGNYTVLVRDSAGCTNMQSVSLTAPNALTLELTVESGLFQLGEEGKIYLDLSIDLADVANFEVTVNETPLTITKTDTIVIVPDASINTYTVTITDQNGCMVSDQIIIQTTRVIDVYIPNIFSPNGDGNNDKFYVQTDEELMVEKMSIYDRWGELIYVGGEFSNNDPTSGWDGTFKGEPVELGVYVYVIDVIFAFDGSKETFTGDITVIR